MTQFYYKAKVGPHEIREGNIEAVDQQSAIAKIMLQGLIPLDIRMQSRTLPMKTQRGVDWSWRKPKIGLNDITVFLWQIHDLVDADIPILRALELLEHQTQNALMKTTLSGVRSLVQEGASLSESLASRPDIFPTYLIAMVRAGEVSGQLKGVLARLCDLTEKQAQTINKIKAGLAYPAVIAGVGFLTVFILLTFVIPRLTVVFSDLGQELPLLTQILLGLSHFLSMFWWGLVGVLILGFVWLRNYWHTLPGRQKIDQIVLTIPYVGELLKISEAERFARVMGIMLESGVEVLPALECAQGVIQNEILKADIQRIRQAVRDGMGLGLSFRRSQIFSDTVMTMIQVGEETGRPQSGFLKWADTYERESERMTKMTTTLLEPMLILVIGGIVGLIVMALLLPIFRMNLIVN